MEKVTPMLSFKNYLEEKVLSIGLNAAHEVHREKHREKHRQEIHDMLHNCYKEIGGYSGLKSGTKEESDAIHDDISKSMIKAVKRDGKISAVNLYKDKYGRKLVAAGHNGTKQGSTDWKKIAADDNQHKRAWGEVSGAVEHIHTKLGFPKIPASQAKEILGKSDIRVSKTDPYKYTRKIGDDEHEKTIMGHLKK